MQEPGRARDFDRAWAGGARSAVLCRWGEIFLKGQNRGFFERKLVDNIRRALKDITGDKPPLAPGQGPSGGRVERLHGRVLVWPPGREGPEVDIALQQTIAALQKVFGLTSLSPVRLVEKRLEAIAVAAVEEARAATGGGAQRPTFKVEARRADKRFPLASPEVARQVGAAIVEALALPVDVHHPALHVGVEIGFEHAFVYARTLAGPGGLPVGSTGRVDLLLSGGIDSPVAGWMAMKRGCEIAATYFHSFPYTGDRTRDKVAALARKLAAWQGELALRVVPFTEAQKALRDAGDPRLAVVLYRRMMMRVAERLARQRGALALVTGEALAQVASQTLENMGVIGAASGLPILRPLVAHDKLETIGWAKRIDTYELSIEPYEDCCSLFVPEHPELRARIADVEAAEARVDVAALVEKCVAGVEVIQCRA
jgi:thiamine biosynthesis protein ThiI